MFRITEEELQGFIDGANSPSFAFLGMSVGAAICFGSVVFSVDLKDRPFALFCALFVLSVQLTIFFSFQYHRERHSNTQRAERIRRQRV